MISGVVIWLGLMLVKTGWSGVIALVAAALFMAGLIILGHATRTATLATFSGCF